MDRRTFLAGAAAASAVPAAAVARPQAELPVDKVHRLAGELAQALAEYDGGSMHAVVFPAGASYAGLKLVYTNLGKMPPEKELTFKAEKLKHSLSEMYPGQSIRVITDLTEKDGMVLVYTNK